MVLSVEQVAMVFANLYREVIQSEPRLLVQRGDVLRYLNEDDLRQ